jgi:hypothetical protein
VSRLAATRPPAEQEGVPDAYVCRLLPLTGLAPDLVEAILDGRQPKALRLAEMLENGRWAGRSSSGASDLLALESIADGRT